MKKRLFLSLTHLLTALLLLAQANNDKTLLCMPSPRGNYVYLVDGAEGLSQPATFLVERINYTALQKGAKADVKTVTVKPVATAAELRRFLSAQQIADLQAALRLSSAEALANHFATHPSPDKYSLAYSFVETRLALGHLYLDEAVEEGVVYVYRVSRVAADGSKQAWGTAITQAKGGNYTLAHFRPELSAVETKDSLVQLTWKMAVPKNKLFEIPVPPSSAPDDTARLYQRILLSPLSTRARLYLQTNGRYTEAVRLLPVVNETADTVTYYYSKPCVPEEPVFAYLVTEDEVYNRGIASDTAVAYAVEQKSVPLVYGIRTKDVLNGVQISWDKLPAKPYLVGVEIGRFNSDNRYDSIATVPAGDTSFVDYAVEVGQTYRYKVKAVFLPQLAVAQTTSAEGVGTFTVFARPLPPGNLTVQDRDGTPFLKWDAFTDPSFYGSFVYRGTSPHDLSVVAGPLRNNQFLDTAKNITGRSEYYYAVLNQNLRQDTSVYSNLVRIVPSKKVLTTAPSTMDFYYANGMLRISWNDVRSLDNAVESFAVQRKTAAQKAFEPLALTGNNYAEDNGVKEGMVYEYRVAAVSYKGDTSAYSDAFRYSLPAKTVDALSVFYLRNTTEGITVSWPSVVVEGRKGYGVYRREAGSRNFTRVGTAAGDAFSFVDKKVSEGKVYVYSLTVLNEDGREGPRGSSLSLRRLTK